MIKVLKSIKLLSNKNKIPKNFGLKYLLNQLKTLKGQLKICLIDVTRHEIVNS